MTDYELLDVPLGATQDEIKKAYRRAAMKNHPDRGGTDAKFQEIKAAYERLLERSRGACPLCEGEGTVAMVSGFFVTRVRCPLCWAKFTG